MTLYQWELQLVETLTLTLEADRQTQTVPLRIEGSDSDRYDLEWNYWGWASDPYGHGLDFDRCKPEDLHFALRLPKFAPLKPRYLGPELAPWEPVPEGLLS